MADCGPNGCECKDANSRCLGPIESVGGAEHRISCCALCSITPGCVQWVISSGVDAQEPAMCWLKSKKGSQSASPKRVIGEVDPAYVQAGCPASNWGSTFLLLAGVACGFYVGGGAAYGARIGGSSRPVALQLHPVTLLAVATVHPMSLSALSPSPFGSVRVTCVVPCLPMHRHLDGGAALPPVARGPLHVQGGQATRRQTCSFLSTVPYASCRDCRTA